MGSLLIKNGEIVTAIDQYLADIYVENGTIRAIGEDLGHSASRVIDASEHYVFPGAIDAHVHMDLPSMGTVSADDFETGTAAGIAGGTTSIIDFAIPNRNESLLKGLAAWKEKAKKAVSDYAFHMAVTWFGDQTAAEMAHCVEHEGIPSFKTYMAYKGAIGVDDLELLEVMKAAKKAGAMVSAHCENGDLVPLLQQKLFDAGLTAPKYHAQSRPAFVEGEATNRAIVMAGAVGVPIYIVHVTAKESLEAIIRARSNGQTVYGETCPQYLLLNDSVYDTEDFSGAAYVMSPPIRPAEGHQERLWHALKSGQIQTVATDHCPFNLHGQKDLGKDDFRLIPNGAAGIQHRLALLYTYGVLQNKISLKQFVEVNCTRPAQLFGMYPRKGSVRIGADADLVIWNPKTEGLISAATHYHRCDSNIFEGYKTVGAPTWVIANGKVQLDDGDLKVERGAGRYIPRQKGQSI
ncbi:MAG: dihydropyrimidinase [SAR324 cluster bacterium]|nr:dihydropyrimidinase [SAR324 cluster bacterium]